MPIVGGLGIAALFYFAAAEAEANTDWAAEEAKRDAAEEAARRERQERVRLAREQREREERERDGQS